MEKEKQVSFTAKEISFMQALLIDARKEADKAGLLEANDFGKTCMSIMKKITE